MLGCTCAYTVCNKIPILNEKGSKYIFIFSIIQEVETDQYYSFFLPELKRIGYDGIFSPKSRAKTMTETERRFVDGCAIFFHKSK